MVRRAASARSCCGCCGSGGTGPLGANGVAAALAAFPSFRGSPPGCRSTIGACCICTSAPPALSGDVSPRPPLAGVPPSARSTGAPPVGVPAAPTLPARCPSTAPPVAPDCCSCFSASCETSVGLAAGAVLASGTGPGAGTVYIRPSPLTACSRPGVGAPRLPLLRLPLRSERVGAGTCGCGGG